MATFEELKTGLETAFDAEGAKGIEATIQINIEDLTNFYVDINDGTLSVVESEHEDPGLTLTLIAKRLWKKYFLEISKLQWELSCKEKLSFQEIWD